MVVSFAGYVIWTLHICASKELPAKRMKRKDNSNVLNFIQLQTVKHNKLSVEMIDPTAIQSWIET